MTPVEERIDHEEAKRIAEKLIEQSKSWPGMQQNVVTLARAYLALLTEHSAREEAIRELLRKPQVNPLPEQWYWELPAKIEALLNHKETPCQ